MSRQYDAKQEALKAYPTDETPVSSFSTPSWTAEFQTLNTKEGMTAEEYIYGKDADALAAREAAK